MLNRSSDSGGSGGVSDPDRRLELLTDGLDAFFLATSGSMVLFMHAGFACLEAGSVRAKNTTNILMKNVADLCFGEFLLASLTALVIAR